ncbi:hypothetical protein GW813_07675, partial [bacterium]|nr:hypothetical protein [bacterium]
RSARCGVIEALCINGATDFLNACLTNVGSRDMSVCDGAPADPDIMTDSNYSGAICERYGWDPIQDGPADTVVAGLEQWCAVNR